LAVDKGARIILAHVIEVPLRYPISASLPQLEQKAEGALRSAALRVKESHLEYETRIVRDRTFAGGLVLLARDAQADMVVVGFDGLFQRGLSDLVVVSELFRHAPCEVLVAREPIPLDEDGLRMGRLIEPSVHV
jgi:nucleotide-binding universal stress UspA family protein